MSNTEENPDGSIVNPDIGYQRDDSVGDAADDANDMRFSEEQQLINEQVRLDRERHEREGSQTPASASDDTSAAAGE
ncbi:hypothetical protein IV498_01760 [Paenarthrobacter sp. Z7-10]|uniref:hypothetical protein n=1 Tax=Paenarthrobacter sp. Z7-10 TaxID=2787635 RepID=UPI0022A96AE6|nr:hypothetical protein [Paenarthrobacter sp. Z7-10]MCZ2401941.1 hypothetical protein [Paenarthrobacter sp. Z7-10]